MTEWTQEPDEIRASFEPGQPATILAGTRYPDEVAPTVRIVVRGFGHGRVTAILAKRKWPKGTKPEAFMPYANELAKVTGFSIREMWRQAE